MQSIYHLPVTHYSIQQKKVKEHLWTNSDMAELNGVFEIMDQGSHLSLSTICSCQRYHPTAWHLEWFQSYGSVGLHRVNSLPALWKCLHRIKQKPLALKMMKIQQQKNKIKKRKPKRHCIMNFKSSRSFSPSPRLPVPTVRVVQG